jgi:NAD(P)-dependent dehydrogenase (short-subunit alcohol dehydrogenase family)
VTVGPEALRLDGRVALVTGAARGIGAAVAVALARCGADVAGCDRDAAGLEETVRAVQALGRRAWSAVLDVRDAAAVRAFVARVAAEAGRLDVLVNNAGGTFEAPFLETSEKGEDALVRENWTSAGHCVRAAAPLLRSGGSIVNLTSIEAHRAGPGYAVYSAMKAALESLTRSLALELGPRGIRVNAVAPDAIATPGVPAPPPAVALGRAGEPDDVAGAVVWLVSDLARFVTGATLHVDGGNHAAGGWRRGADGRFTVA